MRRLVFTAGVFAAMATAAQADDDGHVNPALPALRIEGATTGSAKLKVGADLAFPTGPDSDVTLSPLFVTTTNRGLGNLFSFNDDTVTARDFQLVLQASEVELAHLLPEEAGQRDLREQFDKCVQSCKPTSTDPFCDQVNADKLAQAVDEAAANALHLQVEATTLEQRTATTRRGVDDLKRSAAAVRQQLVDGQPAIEKLDADIRALEIAIAAAKPADADKQRAELKQRQAKRDKAGKALEDARQALAGMEKQLIALQQGADRAADAQKLYDADVTTATNHHRELQDRRKAALAALHGKPRLDDRSVNPGTICADGKKALAEASKRRRDKRLERPRHILTAGVIVGHAEYKFLSPTMDGLFKPDTDTRDSALIAGSATWLVGATTVELPVRLGFSSSLGSKTVKWCVPAGTVTLSGGVTAPGQTCNELAAAPPASLTVFDAAPAFGIMPELETSVRFAFGPVVHVEGEDSHKALVRAGLQLPVYFDTNLLAGDKGTFKGIVKLTSSIIKEWDREHHAEDTRFLLSIELLTGRSTLATDIAFQMP